MRKEYVSGHRRRDHKGKWVKVKSFKRKAKPRPKGPYVPFRQKYEVIYYRDKKTGMIASKRKYKRI